MLPDLAQAVLVRAGFRLGESELARIAGILPLPALADDRARVSGHVRTAADAVCQRLSPHAAWIEVRVLGEHGETTPGVLVLVGGSLAAACLQEQAATVLAAPGDESVTIARRQRDVSALVDALAAAGYAARLHPVDAGDSAPMTTAAWLERFDTRTFRRGWPVDAAIVFVVGSVLSGVSLVMRTPDGRNTPALIAGSVILGAICAGLQFLYAWNQWHERLVAFRGELRAQAAAADLVEFRARPIPWWAQAVMLAMFGGAAVQLARDREWGGMLAAVGIAVATPAYAALMTRAWVRIDATGIEGLGPGGRARIAMADIEAIPAANELEPLFVASRRDRIWISKQLDGREHLFRTLWDRALAVHSGFTTARHDLSEARLLRDIALAVDRARVSGAIASTPLPSMPLILRVVWRDPIRAQYRWQAHLLRHGHVRAARVVGPGALFEPPREAFATVRSARVLLLEPGARETTGAVWDRVRATLGAELEDDDDASPVGQALSRLMPGIRPLPPEQFGPGVWTARLVIDQRALPLQYLRTAWLPVLVDRGGCDFVMPVPPALWPAPVRRAWLAGAPDAFAPSPERKVSGDAATTNATGV